MMGERFRGKLIRGTDGPLEWATASKVGSGSNPPWPCAALLGRFGLSQGDSIDGDEISDTG